MIVSETLSKLKIIMNELVKLLSELLSTGTVSAKGLNVKVTDDGNGNITIKYNSPKNNPAVKQIRAELDAMDDDIFTESAELLMKTDKSAYTTMANIETTTNIPELQHAYKIFKGCVTTVVENRVKSLTTEVNRLFGKYLDNQDKKQNKN